MKKILKYGIVALGALAGCSQDAANAARQVETAKGKVAVIYYSWSPEGNTRFAAETIAKKAGADIFALQPVTPYSSDFETCCKEAKPECRGKLARPVKPVEGLDLAKYDVVFFGTPNWWGTLAPPLRTFITENLAALKGKSVALFQTHGGGGMQSLGKDFAELFGDTATVLPPKALGGSSIRSSTKALEEFVTSRISLK